MQSEKHLNNAVLLYFLLLIVVVVMNIIKHINILDFVYLVALICGAFKYVFVIHEIRK